MGAASAIILARGGSKGLPGKNRLPVAGKPCIAWTIEAAQRSARTERVVVSSDDELILQLARAMGAETHTRDTELASDSATVDDAARTCVRETELAESAFALLYGNVPVRPPDCIDRALALLEETGCDSVQSYSPVGKHHPWWTAKLCENGRVRAWEGDVLNHGVYRRQDLPAAFVPDGAVIALTRAALTLNIEGADPGPHAFFGIDRRGIVNPEGSVVDIDSATDRLVAEAALSGAVA